MVEFFDLGELQKTVMQKGPVVRVVITGFEGSAPRETGASMLVWQDGQSGTIGGGALEFQMAARARKLLGQIGDWRREIVKMPLGPALNQCCGGNVEMLLERYAALEIRSIEGAAPSFTRPKQDGISPTPAPLQAARLLRAERSGATIDAGWFCEIMTQEKTPVWLYGAGHVGREVVRVLTGLPFDINWVDTDRARFPDMVPVNYQCNVNPAALVIDAPDNALHFVLTYSHSHDLEICHQVLSRRFGHLGLIGSASKKARFLKRLRELGHSDAVLARLQCPIGDRSLGKTPSAIAIGLAYWLMQSNIKQRQETTGRVSA